MTTEQVNETAGKAAADSHLPAGGTDTATSGGSTSQTPKTFTQKELDDARAAAGTEAVRAYKAATVDPIVKERDEYKLKAAAVQDTQDTVDDLKRQLDATTKGDTDRLTWVKLNEDLRKAIIQLRNDTAALAASKTDHDASLKRIAYEDRKALATALMPEFEGATLEGLINLAEKNDIKTTDKLRAEAALFWAKKVIPPDPALDLDSGKSNGGAIDWNKASPEARIAEQRRRDKAK